MRLKLSHREGKLHAVKEIDLVGQRDALFDGPVGGGKIGEQR